MSQVPTVSQHVPHDRFHDLSKIVYLLISLIWADAEKISQRYHPNDNLVKSHWFSLHSSSVNNSSATKADSHGHTPWIKKKGVVCSWSALERGRRSRETKIQARKIDRLSFARNMRVVRRHSSRYGINSSPKIPSRYRHFGVDGLEIGILEIDILHVQHRISPESGTRSSHTKYGPHSM